MTCRSVGQPVTIYVGVSLRQLQHTVAMVRILFAAGLPCVLTLVAATTWFTVGQALRPIEAIRREVADISERALNRRVPEPPVNDEVGRLARTMNRMLDRLEQFTVRQRRFVADASHELKSPLAATRSDLERVLAHPEQSDWEEVASGLLLDNAKMSRLVDDLLYLARHDSSDQPPVRSLVDFDAIVRSELRRRPPERVRIDTSRITPCELVGDPDQLARVVRNLVDNAVRHARETVVVTLAETDGNVTLTVADDGPGIPPADHERIFHPFTRLDTSRSRDTGGAGLGLAIVRDIVRAHRGSVTVEDNEPGARFVVRLPRG